MSEKIDFEKEIKSIRKRIWLFNILAWISVSLGLITLLVGFNLYYVENEKFNEVGDFIGGFSGSLWALAGLFFIYIAFLGQKIEIKYQQEDLKLTRDELKETKEVFIQQAQIMNNQQMSNIFFNLLDNHRKFVDSFKKGKKKLISRGHVGLANSHLTDYNVEIISGHDILKIIYSEISNYLNLYSNYIKTNKIFDIGILETNPIKKIEEFSEVRVLFNEVFNLISFIDKNFEKEDRQFYFDTLASNLTVEEKYLTEAYNYNLLNNTSNLVSFGIYKESDYANFVLSSYLEKRTIFIQGRFYSSDNIRSDYDGEIIHINFDDYTNYEKAKLYYIDEDERTLIDINEFFPLEDKIYIDDQIDSLIKGLLKEKFIRVIEGDSDGFNFKILIKAIDKKTKVSLFYEFQIELYAGIIQRTYSFRCSNWLQPIEDWVRNFFN